MAGTAVYNSISDNVFHMYPKVGLLICSSWLRLYSSVISYNIGSDSTSEVVPFFDLRTPQFQCGAPGTLFPSDNPVI